MQLADYLARHDITAAAFARVLGVHPATVGRYLSRKRVPRPTLALRIRRATYGEVTADDFLEPDPRPRLKSPASPPPAGPAPSRRAAAA